MGQETVELGGGIVTFARREPFGIVDCYVHKVSQRREIVAQSLDVVGQALRFPQTVAGLRARREGRIAPLEVQEQPDFEARGGNNEVEIVPRSDMLQSQLDPIWLVAINNAVDPVEIPFLIR